MHDRLNLVTTILDQIVATKREEITRAKAAVPIERLRDALADAPPVRDFFVPLAKPTRRASEDPVTRSATRTARPTSSRCRWTAESRAS